MARNVVNLVPPFVPDASYHGTSAPVEFVERGLEVPEIVPMGHTMYGGRAVTAWHAQSVLASRGELDRYRR